MKPARPATTTEVASATFREPIRYGWAHLLGPLSFLLPFLLLLQPTNPTGPTPWVSPMAVTNAVAIARAVIPLAALGLLLMSEFAVRRTTREITGTFLGRWLFLVTFVVAPAALAGFVSFLFFLKQGALPLSDMVFAIMVLAAWAAIWATLPGIVLAMARDRVGRAMGAVLLFIVVTVVADTASRYAMIAAFWGGPETPSQGFALLNLLDPYAILRGMLATSVSPFADALSEQAYPTYHTMGTYLVGLAIWIIVPALMTIGLMKSRPSQDEPTEVLA